MVWRGVFRVRVRVRVRSESELGLEPHFSVAGGRVHSRRAGQVAQRELVARISLAAQVRLVQRLGFGSADQARIRLAAGQEYRHGYFVWREGHLVRHARRPQL